MAQTANEQSLVVATWGLSSIQCYIVLLFWSLFYIELLNPLNICQTGNSPSLFVKNPEEMGIRKAAL